METLAQRLDRLSIPEPNSGCWLWLGSYQTRYGSLMFRGVRKQAHRYAWELENGPVPVGMYVCHHCDNRGCVRASHLFAGTALDNTRDMDAKGRRRVVAPSGERSPEAKLTDAQAVAAVGAIALGSDRRNVGACFGVTAGLVA